MSEDENKPEGETSGAEEENLGSREDETDDTLPTNQEFKVLEELGPRMRNINLKVKCVNKSEVREVSSRKDNSTHRVAEATIGDETGSIILTLWDDAIDKVEPENVYNIINGYTSLFRGNLRLNLGKFGKIGDSDEHIPEVSLDNNLSDKKYERERRGPPRYDSRRGGGYGSSRRGYRDHNRRSVNRGRSKYTRGGGPRSRY